MLNTGTDSGNYIFQLSAISTPWMWDVLLLVFFFWLVKTLLFAVSTVSNRPHSAGLCPQKDLGQLRRRIRDETHLARKLSADQLGFFFLFTSNIPQLASKLTHTIIGKMLVPLGWYPIFPMIQANVPNKTLFFFLNSSYSFSLFSIWIGLAGVIG